MKQPVLAILAAASFFAVNTHAAPDARCTSTLTPDGAGFLLQVPIALTLPDSLAAGAPVTAYRGDFTVTPVGSGLDVKLKTSAITTEKPPYNCQAATLVPDANGAFSLTVPQITYNGASYSAALKQQPGTPNFSVDSTGPGRPASLPPKGSIRCVGVTHEIGMSLIKVCVDVTNVPDSAWQSSGASITTGSGTRGGYGYSYGKDSLTKTCAFFTINEYGSYSGLFGFESDGGVLALPWNITVDAATQACS